ncbi:MAG: energy coupling factor transporter S component ThiW [Candidatus Methanomethylicaceae archaeon]
MRNENVTRSATKRIVLSAIMIALGTTFSIFPGAIPIGPTKVFPFQHMINGITGVIMGPFIGGFIALGIGILRISIGTGTFFAIPGGIPGALVVGIIYHYLKKSDWVALTEPIGTAIGALISAFLVAPFLGTPALPPFMGITTQWQLFIIFFSMSSVPGAILGLIILLALRRRGVLDRLQF